MPALRNILARSRPAPAQPAGDDKPEAHPPAASPGARNPVIVIPGVLGSKLVADADSQAVWGEWRGRFKDPASGEGAQLFGLPMQIGKPLDQLVGTSHAEGALGTVRGYVAGLPVTITAYGDVMSAMGVESFGGTFMRDRTEASRAGETAFEFSYDWRRSLDESAREFEAFVQRATRFLQVQRNWSAPIRFDVVAHSMGGLVLRYFLQYGGQLLPYDGSGPRLNWDGAAYVDKAFIIGTPNAGSIKMVDRLVRGIPGNPLHPTYGPVLIGSSPSGYQLLPRSRHRIYARGDCDLLDPEFWLTRDWGIAASWLDAERARQMPGIASPAERLAVAEDHLRKCLMNARHFQDAMDRPVTAMPKHLAMHLFIGTAQRTPAEFDGQRPDRAARFTRFAPGDGTVLASSVRLDEADGKSPIPWTSVTTLGSSHMGLMKDPVLLARVLEQLGASGAGSA